MFKQKKHRTFNYKPRFTEESKDDGNTEESREFASKWRRENAKTKKTLKGGMSMRFLILALVLLLICMYLLEKKYM